MSDGSIGRAPTCRSCEAAGLTTILDFGPMPLANGLLTPEQLGEAEEVYPLTLAFCPRCALVQITETVPPEKLFREYLYFSSFSDTLLAHAEEIARRMITDRRLDARGLVVEVASNDGYLLQHYRQAGIPVLGIDPAVNVARVAEQERGVPTLCEFFGEPLARQLRALGRQADVIHANNVLAHVADLNGVVEGFRLLLKPGGVVVVEVPYLKDLVERTEFDTIYHEHLCYFSLLALDALFARHGLLIHDVERLPIHGGSLRLFAGHAAENPARSSAVRDLLVDEAVRGMHRADYYARFANAVTGLGARLRGLLGDLKARNNRLAAYGAAAKGSTLLNHFGIGRDLLEFVVDRSTHKQGRFTPGTRLPIVAPSRLLDLMPDYVLLLTWNFAEEIMAQQAEYRARGGRFIVPIPEPRVAG